MLTGPVDEPPSGCFEGMPVGEDDSVGEPEPDGEADSLDEPDGDVLAVDDGEVESGGALLWLGEVEELVPPVVSGPVPPGWRGVDAPDVEVGASTLVPPVDEPLLSSDWLASVPGETGGGTQPGPVGITGLGWLGGWINLDPPSQETSAIAATLAATKRTFGYAPRFGVREALVLRADRRVSSTGSGSSVGMSTRSPGSWSVLAMRSRP